MGRFTNEEIEKLTDLYYKNYSFGEIGRELGRSGQVIGKKVKLLGLNRETTTMNCEYCNKEFEKLFNCGVVKRFCSENCKHKARRKRNPKPPKIANCKYCNSSYIKRYTSLYCSDECRKEHYRKQYNRKRTIKLYRYKCIECGKHGYSKRKKDYCSDKCSDMAYSKKRQMKSRRFKKCLYCHHWHYKSRVYCSDECSKRNMKRNQVIAKTKRMTKARQNGQFDADIDIYKLIERDGEQCYLCGDTVHFNVHYNDPKYPTIEHVLAIANGGTHSWENVKVACRDCNNHKGTKTLKEVM